MSLKGIFNISECCGGQGGNQGDINIPTGDLSAGAVAFHFPSVDNAHARRGRSAAWRRSRDWSSGPFRAGEGQGCRAGSVKIKEETEWLFFFILSHYCLYWAIPQACRFGLEVLQIRGAIYYIIENRTGESFIKRKTFHISFSTEHVSHFGDMAGFYLFIYLFAHIGKEEWGELHVQEIKKTFGMCQLNLFWCIHLVINRRLKCIYLYLWLIIGILSMS